MKKVLILVAAAMIAAVSVSAQKDLRHEISLSYGAGSSAQFGEGLGEGLVMAIFSDTEYDDGFILGPISLEYFYHLNNPRVAIGGFVSYSKWDSDIQKKNSSHDKVGERNRSYISVMPSIKYYWTNNDHFGFYSKVAAGAAFLSSTEKKLEDNKTKDDNSTHFLFQVSAIGLEFGSKFRGYTELGVGEQGFIQVGVRYKF